MFRFICKDFWAEVFRKHVDNLKTNHRVSTPSPEGTPAVPCLPGPCRGPAARAGRPFHMLPGWLGTAPWPLVLSCLQQGVFMALRSDVNPWCVLLWGFPL